jgi:SAM-dependent methyltransferase
VPAVLEQLTAEIRRHPTLARPARRVHRWLLGLRQQSDASTSEATIAEQWDEYARDHRRNSTGSLGGEWNDPAKIGVDVPADQIVPMLDERVFDSFLGRCEVMLEIGPGGGRFTEILLPKCEHLIAADTSPAMLDLLRERFPSSPKLQCLLLDGRGLQAVEDGSVDAAFSYGVFVHLQHWDMFQYLVELHRVLKPGGRAVVQHPNTFSELGWQKFLIDLPLSLNTPKLAGSFTVMTPELMRGFVERAGLQVEQFVEDVVRRDCISLLIRPE